MKHRFVASGENKFLAVSRLPERGCPSRGGLKWRTRCGWGQPRSKLNEDAAKFFVCFAGFAVKSFRVTTGMKLKDQPANLRPRERLAALGVKGAKNMSAPDLIVMLMGAIISFSN